MHIWVIERTSGDHPWRFWGWFGSRDDAREWIRDLRQCGTFKYRIRKYVREEV